MTILYHEEPTTAEPTTKDGTRPALGIRVVGFEVKAYRFPPLLFIESVVCVTIEPFSTTASFHCSVNHDTDYPDGGHPKSCEHFGT